MEKQDIIDYVLRTPGNTNPAVLDGMLNSIDGGGSEEGVLIFEGDVEMSFKSADLPVDHDSICLDANYKNGLYKFYFDDEVVYLLAYDISSSGDMAGYPIRTVQTSSNFAVDMYSPNQSRPAPLGNVYAQYYYYEGPAKTMHIKVYQLA